MMVWECNSVTRCECGGLLPYSSARELFGGAIAAPTVDGGAHDFPNQSKPQILESSADRAARGLKNAF